MCPPTAQRSSDENLYELVAKISIGIGSRKHAQRSSNLNLFPSHHTNAHMRNHGHGQGAAKSDKSSIHIKNTKCTGCARGYARDDDMISRLCMSSGSTTTVDCHGARNIADRYLVTLQLGRGRKG